MATTSYSLLLPVLMVAGRQKWSAERYMQTIRRKEDDEGVGHQSKPVQQCVVYERKVAEGFGVA